MLDDAEWRARAMSSLISNVLESFRVDFLHGWSQQDFDSVVYNNMICHCTGIAGCSVMVTTVSTHLCSTQYSFIVPFGGLSHAAIS